MEKNTDQIQMFTLDLQLQCKVCLALIILFWYNFTQICCAKNNVLDLYRTSTHDCKTSVVGQILTFFKDALFPSKSVWRAILRQQVLQSNTQTMKQELMHNGNEWLSPNVVDTYRVSNLWSICRNSPSLSVVCRKLLRIFALFISRLYVRQFQKCLLRTENMGVHLLCCCPITNYEHL